MDFNNKTVEAICAVLAHDLGTDHIVMHKSNGHWFASIKEHTINTPDYINDASSFINHVEVTYNRYANNQKCRDYKNTLEKELNERVTVKTAVESISDELRIYFDTGLLHLIYTTAPVTKLVENSIQPYFIANDAIDWVIEQIEEYIRK